MRKHTPAEAALRASETNRRKGRLLTHCVRRDAFLLAEVHEHTSSKPLRLGLDAFLSLQPTAIRAKYTPASLSMCFRAFDASGDGMLDVYDLFRLSLCRATSQHGRGALRAAFAAHDWNTSGQLDSLEFLEACTVFGFGPASGAIFNVVDRDGSGSLSGEELVATFSALPSACDGDSGLRALLESLFAEHDAASESELVRMRDMIHTRGWQLQGGDVASLRAELQAHLEASGGSTLALVSQFGAEADERLDPTSVGLCYAYATPTLRPRYAHATPTLRPRYAYATPTLRPRFAHATPTPCRFRPSPATSP